MNDKVDLKSDSVSTAALESEAVLEHDDAEGTEARGESIDDMIQAQDRELVEFATNFLKSVLRLRGVRIDREKFLTAELHKRGFPGNVIARAIAENPAAAGIPPAILDDIATESVAFETRKSSALSFAAGLPGGLAMLGTVPADVTQFYMHAFRVMQKIAYTYGWQSFLSDVQDIDDETLGKLAAFLGVMMGVGGASTTVSRFAAQVAMPAVQKNIASKALTKTAWYPVMKQTLKIIGIKVTKDSFAKTVSKVVPVAGGFVSGGLTFVALNQQSTRLVQHLREIPPPHVDAAEYLAALKRVEDDEAGRTRVVASAFRNAGNSIKGAASDAVDKFRSPDEGSGLSDHAADSTADAESVISNDKPTLRAGVKEAAADTAGKLGGLLRRKGKQSEVSEAQEGLGDGEAAEV